MNGEKLTFTLESYSNQYSTSYPATNSFDGSTSTYWRTSDVTGAYLIVKVDSPIQLAGFRIYPNTSSYRVASFGLSISDDGVNFDDVYSGQCSSTSSWLEHEFESNLVGKYIKLTFNSASTSRLYVYEFELYGESISYKYLIRKNGVLYKTDGTELGQLELTSAVFKDQGGDFPATEVLTSIVDAEILRWNDSINTPFNVLETATPFTQTLESKDYYMTNDSILGIERVLVDASDDVRFAISFNSGLAWKMHTGESWATLTESDTGMSASVMSAITTEDWNLEATTGKFRFRITIPSLDSYLNSLVVDYLN